LPLLKFQPSYLCDDIQNKAKLFLYKAVADRSEQIGFFLFGGKN